MYLLDTHVLLWALQDSSKLTDVAKKAISQSACVVSVASLWEISIKHSLGKLDLAQSVTEIAAKCSEYGIRLLAIRPEHCQFMESLPFIHRDPFDRMLIAQAHEENLILITKDEFAVQYSIHTLW